MQTYVPIPNAVEVALILNNQDICTAMDTALFLIREMHIDGQNTIVAKHPVFRMWRGYGPALCDYGLTMADEISKRNFMSKDNAQVFLMREKELHEQLENATSGEYTLDYPAWWGDVFVHEAHKSELLRHDPKYYRRHFAGIELDLPMVWPAA